LSGLLYKYRDFDDKNNPLDILNKKQLWLAEPKTLNDPFDCQIEYAKLFDDAIRELKITNAAIESFKKSSREVMNNLRVLSLSSNEINPLLWAHYANKHKGFCLGFDFGYGNTFINPKLRPQKVNYSSDLPQLKFSNLLLNSNFNEKKDIVELVRVLDDFIYKVALTKPSEWTTEGEFRTVTQHPMQGKSVKFAKMALREVVLGLNIDSTNQDNITQILAEDEWKHVKLFKIEKENGSFSLTKKELV
jgi:hypothetical protein